MRQFTLFLGLFSAITVLNSVPLYAQNAKPADVLLVVDTVQAQLESFYEASFKSVSSPALLALTPRRPRHVYQKASEVFLKVQVLRRLNGLALQPLPAAPEHEITPGDVREMVLAVSASVDGLIPSYWVAKTTFQPRRREGATPTDVYQSLHGLSVLLDGLGIPTVVPNDVHALAVRALEDVHAIYLQTKGAAFNGKLPAFETGKSPSDAYNKAYDLLMSIQELTADERYAIPAGVVMPEMETGSIKPAQVRELVGTVLAELGSIKTAINVPVTAKADSASAGMTPSNVFHVLAQAQVILNAIKS